MLNPLLSMAVLSLIFSRLFRRSIDNYPIYYLTGYILWQTFTGATIAAMTTLADNKMLLLRVKFPMDLFILARVYTAMVNLGYSLIAYAVMLAVFRVPPRWTMLFSPAVILCLFFFALGVSYLLAAAYVFFGDIRHLYTVFLTLWMYCSAVFYPVGQLQGFMRTLVEEYPLFIFYRLSSDSRYAGAAAGNGPNSENACLEYRDAAAGLLGVPEKQKQNHAAYINWDQREGKELQRYGNTGKDCAGGDRG